MAQYLPPESLKVGNGTETVFGFTFPYLRAEDIALTVDDVAVPVVLVGTSQVSINPAPADGAQIRIYRNTPAQYPQYLFATGVPMLPKYIDENNNQLLYALQEGLLDFGDVRATAENAVDIANAALDTAGQAVTTANSTAALVTQSLARVVRAPLSDPTMNELPGVAARANRVMGFNAQGHPVALVPESGSATALALDLANAVTPGKGAGMVGYRSETVATALDDLRELEPTLGGVGSSEGISKIGRAVVAVPSIYALNQLQNYRTDALYRVSAWQTPMFLAKLRGGGYFVYDPTCPKSKHNGGYIHSPTVPLGPTVAATPAYLAGVGETDPTGLGCLVRLTEGDIYAEYFGLFEDAAYNWNCRSFNAALKWADVVAPDINPGTVRFLDGQYRTTDPIIMTRALGVTGRIPSFLGPGAYNAEIIKTTNNTTGAAYPWLNIDAAVIELPPDGANNYIGGANSGGFSLRKLGDPGTGYGYYAARSYFGKRGDMTIRGFNRGFTSTDCWMNQLNKIWTLINNVGFTLSGTSNFGTNLYAGSSREIGFDIAGLTYSVLHTACDGTGDNGTTPRVAYKFSGCHGVTLVAGAEKTVGLEFDILNCNAMQINGHSFGTGVSSVPTQKVRIVNSTGRMSFDWNLSLNNLSEADKKMYQDPGLGGTGLGLFTRDAPSTWDFVACNFGDLDSRLPRVLDGRIVSTVELAPYRVSGCDTYHSLALSSTIFKKACYIGASGRFQFLGALCEAPGVDTSFEPTVARGHAVASFPTTAGAAAPIGDLYIGDVANAGRLVGYISGGWLYVRGPGGQQRVHGLRFVTAPMG